MAKKRVLILTGGGPAPGHNAVIYAVAKRLLDNRHEVIGCLDGWKGLIEGNIQQLTLKEIDRIYLRGGTILYTSRTNLRKVKVDGKNKDLTGLAAEFIKSLDIDLVVALGGNDTTTVAAYLSKNYGIKIICGPKTIDNDLWGTDQCYGFDTAANTVANLLREMHDDFKSTRYVGVFEIMGRDSGFLTLYGGMSGGAHLILIPEFPLSIDEIITRTIAIHKRYGYCMIAAAENLNMPELADNLGSGTKDAFGNISIAERSKGWAEVIAEQIKLRSGLQARHNVIGHLCRKGAPSAADTMMCLRIGTKIFELIEQDASGQLVTWGNPPGIIQLSETVDEAGIGKIRTVPEVLYKEIMALLSF